jgi:hypothetical protein
MKSLDWKFLPWANKYIKVSPLSTLFHATGTDAQALDVLEPDRPSLWRSASSCG